MQLAPAVDIHIHLHACIEKTNKIAFPRAFGQKFQYLHTIFLNQIIVFLHAMRRPLIL